MTEYRWNQSELAAGYDAGAALVHPYYVEVQDAILAEMEAAGATDGLTVDLGGGSGRLVERMLERWPRATAVIVDQSQSFLDLAQRRLDRFTGRVKFHCLRLQEDWRDAISDPAAAIVSMSAIHHLDPVEKQTCYQRCFETLRLGGVLLNGDEVRADSDVEYRGQVERWAAHMRELIRTEAVTPAMADALRGWEERNVARFDEPRMSGDDCHETAETQLSYFRSVGFAQTGIAWQRALWTVLRGRKAV
ncbi:MAG: trans-aconitate 2-methyltransferase [Planctomycetaceae bacterium]